MGENRRIGSSGVFVWVSVGVVVVVSAGGSIGGSEFNINDALCLTTIHLSKDAFVFIKRIPSSCISLSLHF